MGAAALAVMPDLLLAPPPAVAAPMVGTRGLVGCSVFRSTYTNTATRIAASTEFDHFVERNACFNVQRVYFGVGEWATPDTPGDLVELAENQIKMVVSFKPDGIQQSEYANLQTSLAFLQQLRGGLGAVFEVSLWHEANHDTQRFPTASDYKDLVAYYAPAVQAAGFPLVYIPIMSTGNAVAYDPGPALCDRISADYYADMYFVNGARLETIAAHADQSGRPFGITEWGLTASSAFVPTHAQFKTFASYIQGVMTGRLQAGKTNGDVIWFDTGGSDNITATDDWKIPIFQSVYDALNG